MKKTKSNASCETRIRHHIISIIYNHPDETVMIPSTYKLAEELGVARSSILTAVKKLKDEGYLIGRRGVGIFTNPKSMTNHKQKPLIGILIGKGDQFYYGRLMWNQAALSGQALTNRGFNVKLLSEGIAAESTLSLNFKYHYVDAVFCVGSNEETINSIIPYLPVVAIDRLWSATMGISFSSASAAVELKQRLDRENRHRFLCLINMDHEWEVFRLHELFHDVFDFGTADFLSYQEDNFEKLLEERLMCEHYDMIFGYDDALAAAFQIMKKLNIDCLNNTYLFALREVSPDFPAPVFFMNPPLAQAIDTAAQMLSDKFNGIELKDPRRVMNTVLHVPSVLQ